MKHLIVDTKYLIASIALAAGILSAAGAAEAPAWTPDLVHSRAEFTVSHMVLSKVWGHIPIRSIVLGVPKGSLIPDKIDTVLNVAHEDTDNHDRDADLRSAVYFDVAQYPNITFKSTKIEASGKSDFNVTGDLTIKNVTKSVTFPAHVEGIIPDKTGVRVGYSGKLAIDRRDWGINDARLTEAGVLLVGYTVDIGLTVEATSDDKSLLHAR